ncbi:MAG: hypothetical protein ACOC3V_03580 [bacterium]
MQLFHLVKEQNDSIKKYGLLSPRAMYNLDLELFKKIAFRIYYSRTKTYLNKKEIVPEDILTYLDNARKPLTSTCIFFNLVSIVNFMSDYKLPNRTEYIIDENNLKGKMVLVYKDKRKIVNDKMKLWDIMDLILKNARKHPNNKQKIFSKIPHIAIDCERVPYKFLEKIDYNKIYEIKKITQKLGKVINHGFVGKDGKIYKEWNTDILNKYFRMQNYKDILKSKYAMSWEISEVFRKIFNKFKFHNKVYYISHKMKNIEKSHAFNIVKMDGIFVWDFHYTHNEKRNIKGPFLSFDHALNFMINQLYKWHLTNEEKWYKKNIYYSEVPRMDNIKGITIQDYINRLNYKSCKNLIK